MKAENYDVLYDESQQVPVKTWTRGVPFDDNAKKQLSNIAQMPFIHKWVAAMPDVHLGIGATIGSVIPTIGAVIPAAVGVDLGCGMMAAKTSLRADQLPDDLSRIRSLIEHRVPHGFVKSRKQRDTGSWANVPDDVALAWKPLHEGFERLKDDHPFLKNTHVKHTGHWWPRIYWASYFEGIVGKWVGRNRRATRNFSQ